MFPLFPVSQTISQPASVQELLVLNEACQRERIDFTFSSTTFLVSLALVQKMTKAVGGTLSIVERPSVNPFGHARGATTAPPHSQAQIHQVSCLFLRLCICLKFYDLQTACELRRKKCLSVSVSVSLFLSLFLSLSLSRSLSLCFSISIFVSVSLLGVLVLSEPPAYLHILVFFSSVVIHEFMPSLTRLTSANSMIESPLLDFSL